MFLSSIGIVHFAASVISLASGTLVLRKSKGTKAHRQLGYLYTVSMLIVLTTSFMLYRLHGTFGILHWFAVISSLTLLCGIIPMFLKRPNGYLKLHLSFMYWSVIGLYCAFFAEVLTRIPFILKLDKNILTIFYLLVGAATAIVGGLGSVYFRKHKDSWIHMVDNFEKKSEK
ncbi:DUF2306 domain-containing protein [Aquimarina sp. SS2-1]|uniref:DUF2306 domain-containing protein n=1 Tax=Aquimarina besae TaxID=3342247 RepID=UPI00366D9D05